MPNPSEPDRDEATRDEATPEPAEPEAPEPAEPDEPAAPEPAEPPEPDEPEPEPDEAATDNHPAAPADAEPATEALAAGDATEVLAAGDDEPPTEATPQRRFTAPGFDAGFTEVIGSAGEPATESLPAGHHDPDKAIPQQVGPQPKGRLRPGETRGWGWVVALLLVVAALAAVAVAGTVWLSRGHGSQVSQEDRVRATIDDYDTAVQTGDLTELRTITCGAINDGYLNFNDKAWADTYRRVAAAKRYPVVASIDQVVVNGDHAEANVTAFMAHAPNIRSTRSFDLQYRDDQWKVCQTSTG